MEQPTTEKRISKFRTKRIPLLPNQVAHYYGFATSDDDDVENAQVHRIAPAAQVVYDKSEKIDKNALTNMQIVRIYPVKPRESIFFTKPSVSLQSNPNRGKVRRSKSNVGATDSLTSNKTQLSGGGPKKRISKVFTLPPSQPLLHNSNMMQCALLGADMKRCSIGGQRLVQLSVEQKKKGVVMHSIPEEPTAKEEDVLTGLNWPNMMDDVISDRPTKLVDYSLDSDSSSRNKIAADLFPERTMDVEKEEGGERKPKTMKVKVSRKKDSDTASLAEPTLRRSTRKRTAPAKFTPEDFKKTKNASDSKGIKIKVQRNQATDKAVTGKRSARKNH